MKYNKHSFGVLAFTLILMACGSQNQPNAEQANQTPASITSPVGQSGVKDDVSNPNIVHTAIASKDHSTLGTAVLAAGLVDALSNAGPFTVFAPTNAAFDLLPAGTVEGLLKPEKKVDLKDILEYHTYVGVLKPEYMQDGQQFEQVNGQKISVKKDGDKLVINGTANVIASVMTSNGIIHVVDAVLLPPAK